VGGIPAICRVAAAKPDNAGKTERHPGRSYFLSAMTPISTRTTSSTGARL
jgi:hypothetical protein